MDMSSARWISEMVIDDYNFINQCQMNCLDDEFTTQPLVGDNIHPNSWKFSSTAEEVTKKASSSSSSHITFANSGSPPPTRPQNLYGTLDFSSGRPKDNKAYAQKGTKRACTITRSPLHAQDHVMSERKRREKLSQRFIALSALVPGLKKMDKATVLGDAAKYLKQLQERVKALEEQTERESEESVVFVKKCQLSGDDHGDSSSGENSHDGSNETVPEIEARVSGKNLLIRIHCQHKNGILVKILCKLSQLHLSVVNTSVLPFGKYAMDITVIAQMEDEFCMAVMDLVRSLRSDFLEFK